MKANEMPERVYLFDYNDAMVTPLEGDTTYVREDTFIEKALRFLDLIHANVYIFTNVDNKRFIDEFRKLYERRVRLWKVYPTGYISMVKPIICLK